MSRLCGDLSNRAAIVCLLAVVAASASLASAADSPWLYGIHFYGEPSNGNVEVMTGGKGIWSLEIVVTNSDPWWQAEYQRDHRFNHMISQGHSIICRIEPQWGIAVPKEPNYPMATYLAQVQQTATALQDVVHIWHPGNEMNLTVEWGGDVLTPAEYVDAYKQIRAAIKAVPSSLGEQIVLLGPLSPGPPAGVRHTDSSRYLAEMCALLTPNDVDGFAIHGYGAPWANAADARLDFQSSYAAQTAIIDHFGFGDKPVYITEWNRRVTNEHPGEEAWSAQFLHGAFSDLHAWNQRGGAHPISAACWFIYQYDDSVWNTYSIEYLHTINPAGADNDLFDAFQYACTQNYPAGVPGVAFEHISRDGTPPGQNIAPTAAISASTGTPDGAIDGILDLSHMWSTGGQQRIQWLQLDLGSVRTLSGFAAYHAEAIGFDPAYNTQVLMLETAPAASGPWTIREKLYVDEAVTSRTLLAPIWAQHVRLSIPDGGREPSVFIGEWELNAITAGDCDDDGDVDLTDLASFQICYEGAATKQTDSACLCSHFDEDGFVAVSDFSGLESSLSGPIN